MSDDCFTLSMRNNDHVILAKILCENEDNTHIVTAMNSINNRRVLVDRKTFHLVSKFNRANCIYKIFDKNQITVHTCFVYNFVTSKKTCTFVDKLVNYIMHRRFPKNGNFLQLCKIETPVCASYVYKMQKQNVKSIVAMKKPEKLSANQIAQGPLTKNELLTMKLNESKVPAKQKFNGQLTSSCANDINCRTDTEHVSTIVLSNENKNVTSTQLVSNARGTADRKNVSDNLWNTSPTRKVPILQPYASLNLDQSMNLVSEIENIPGTSWTIKPYNKLQRSSIVERSERSLNKNNATVRTMDNMIESNILSMRETHLRTNRNSSVPQEIDKTKVQSVQCHVSDVSRMKPAPRCNSTVLGLLDEKNYETQNVQTIETTTLPSYYFVNVPSISTNVQEDHRSTKVSNNAEEALKVSTFKTLDKSQTANITRDIEQNLCLPSTSNIRREQLPSTQQINLDNRQIPRSADLLSNISNELQPVQINKRASFTNLNTASLQKKSQGKPVRKKFKQTDNSGNKTHTSSNDDSMNKTEREKNERSISKLVHRNKEDFAFTLFNHRAKVLHISELTKCSEQNEFNTLQYAFEVLNRCARKTKIKDFQLEFYKECITSNTIGMTNQNQSMENDINSSVSKLIKNEETYLSFADWSDDDNTKTNEKETVSTSEISKDELINIRKSSRSRKLNVRNLYEEYQYPYKRTSGNFKDRYNKNKGRITSSINVFKSEEKQKINISETVENMFFNDRKLTNTKSTSNNDETKLYDELLCKKYNIKKCNVRVTRIDEFWK